METDTIIADHVRNAQKSPRYETSITDYFGRKPGPKTKFVNKKRKTRRANSPTKDNIIDATDLIESSSSSDENETDQPIDKENPAITLCLPPKNLETSRLHRVDWSSKKIFLCSSTNNQG